MAVLKRNRIFFHRVPHSGKFSWGRNFRDFRDRMPSRENFFPRKFLPPKIFAWEFEKAKRITVEPRIRRQDWPQFVIEEPSKLRKLYLGKRLRSTCLSSRNYKWIFGVSLFPSAWQFIANSYSHALVCVLASYSRFNVVVQAWFPRQGCNFTHKIVGGVVLDCDQVAKLKIANFFSWCVCWWFVKIYARKNFPAIR